MNRIKKYSIATMAAVSVAAGALAVAGTGVASASTGSALSPRTAVSCTVSARNYLLPKAPETFKAGSAGSVAVAIVNSGTIRVGAVHANKGWHAFVDSPSGSSVDVYFHTRSHTLKFEAEINDSGGLTVRITSC